MVEMRLATHRRAGRFGYGGVFAPVLDSEKRPITAGGFVKTGPIVFQDISEKAGLTVWSHKMGTPQKSYILETIGSGVALLDYDTTDGSTLHRERLNEGRSRRQGRTAPCSTLHNNHDGNIYRVAAKAGVTNDRWASVCWCDYDNDGWPDLYVPIMERTVFITTIMTAHSRMWPRRLA